MAKKRPTIVIVMPTYNEAENIGRMVDVLFSKVFPKIKGAQMKLLVVDDNSPDGTGDVVRKKQKKYRSVYLLTGEKKGLGMAYVRGFEYAIKKLKADAVMEMDGDFQHDPAHALEMVAAFLGGADYVIGSRYVAGGSIPSGWEWYRKAISYFGNLYARLVLWLPKLHDVTTGFRLTRVSVLKKIKLRKLMELHRFAHKMDLYYQTVKLSSKTVEVPIQFGERTMEKSKFNLDEIVASYKVVMLLRIQESARFLKFAVAGFIGFLVNAVGIEFFRALPFTESIAASSSGFPVLNEASAWAAALGAELAIISNFVLNNIWTFSEKKINEPILFIKKFLMFNMTSLGAIVIQFIVIGVAASVFGDTALVRQIALVFSVIFLIVPYNYIVYNLFIWKTWQVPKLLRTVFK